jgi:glycosyltransferase involved in cell wall biosynthesis
VTPTVSVILPVYNAERHVADALGSVLAQTYRVFEVIAIDDGSRDRSLTILRDMAAKDDRVRIVSRPNKGLVATLNEGLALARGTFIARMDADDRCLPERFEQQVRRLQSEPALVAVGCRVIAIDPEDFVLGVETLALEHDDIEEAHLAGSSMICHPAVMMRAEAVRRVGGYRELVPVEDFDLWLRLGEIGRLANLEEPLLMYRRSATGMIASNWNRRHDALEGALREAWRRRGLPVDQPMPVERLRSAPDLYRQWGWMAIDSGHADTARKYAWRAVRAQPWRWESWKLAMSAARQGRR